MKIKDLPILGAVPPGGYVIVTKPYAPDPALSLFAKVPASALGGPGPGPGTESVWDGGASVWDGGASVWDSASTAWLAGFALWLETLPQTPPARPGQPWNDGGRLAFTGVTS